MAFNGSGTFLINTAGQPVVSGTVISSTAFNALTADLATGLSTAITKDGQTTVTANIPMSTYKFTGLGVGSAATDSANLSQVQSTVTKLLTSVSGTDTITAVGAPVVAAYAAGQMFYFVATGDNTGAVTLNIDSLGAKAVTRDGSVALAAGDIKSGEVVVVVYDGTRFQVVSQLNSAGNATFANVSITSALNVGGVATFTANPVLSGGTANGVLYLNGSKVATSGSALTFDGTNGLGFGTGGTGSTTALLTIKGSNATNSGAAITGTRNGAGSWFIGDAQTALGGGTLGFIYYNYTLNDPWIWYDGGASAERMRLTSTGLGIGTSSPTEKLHVAGALRVTGAQTTAGTGVYLDQTSGTGGVSVYGPDNSTQGTFRIYTATANGGTGSTKLTLDSSGNLGLGITPSAWFSSFKAYQVGNQSLWSAAGGNGYLSNNAFFNTSSQYTYRVDGYATEYIQSVVNGSHSWHTAPSGTAGNAISFTQAMTLDANGNLVLGTTSALSSSYRITSYGGRVNFAGNNDALNLYLQYSNGTAGVFIGSPAANVLAFSDSNGTERARITAGGNLLVGTTSDNGYHRFVKSNTSDWICTFTNSSATTPWGISVGYSAAAPNNTDSGISLSDTGGERATIRNNGGLANYSANNVNLSDERTKKNIVPLGSMWDKFKAIEIVKFKYRDQTHDDDNIGVIAQQVESVAPEFVDIDGFGETPEDGVPFKTVYTTDMYHAAIKALQEAMARIEQLEAKFAALESK